MIRWMDQLGTPPWKHRSFKNMKIRYYSGRVWLLLAQKRLLNIVVSHIAICYIVFGKVCLAFPSYGPTEFETLLGRAFHYCDFKLANVVIVGLEKGSPLSRLKGGGPFLGATRTTKKTLVRKGWWLSRALVS